MTNHRGTRTTRRVPRRSRRFPLNRFARLKRLRSREARDLHQSARQVVRPSVVRARQAFVAKHAAVARDRLERSVAIPWRVFPGNTERPGSTAASSTSCALLLFRAVFETFFETSREQTEGGVSVFAFDSGRGTLAFGSGATSMALCLHTFQNARSLSSVPRTTTMLAPAEPPTVAVK